jgi:hypothetical protein
MLKMANQSKDLYHHLLKISLEVIKDLPDDPNLMAIAISSTTASAIGCFMAYRYQSVDEAEKFDCAIEFLDSVMRNFEGIISSKDYKKIIGHSDEVDQR